jgi:hypothetical protein
MTGYLEILGQSFTTPDPDSVASLSASYSAVCTTIEDAKTALSAIGSPQATAQWSGQAADTFASRLGNLPGQLEQAWESYNTVARALYSYAGSLRPVVSALRSLAYQAEEAEGTLAATRAARDQAVHQPNAAAWDTRLAEAQAAVEQLKLRLASLLDELRTLSAECVRLIRQAQHEAIHSNLITDLRRDLTEAGRVVWRVEDDILHVEDDVLHVGITVAADLTVRPFENLKQDAVRFWQDPSVANFGKCLDDLSSVVGVLAVLAAPIPGLDAVLLLASFGLAVAGMVTDGVAAAKHEEGWGQVGMDAVGVALTGSGAVIAKGLDVTGLADGVDADVSAGSLWDTGVGHFFDIPDGPVEDPLATYSDNIDSDLNLGVSSDASPEAVPYEHVEFALNRANDVLEIAGDQESSSTHGH